MMSVHAGATDVTTYFVLRSTTDGTELTGATITNIDLQYTRSGVAPAAKVDATALAATDSAHADNKAIEIDATDQPGLYRVDWPDAAFAAGVREVILSVKYTGAFTEHLRVMLDPPVSVEQFGGTNGTFSSGIPSVNVAQVSGDSTAADTLELFAEALDQSTGQIDNGTFAAGAIDAAAIADNAIDAGALAADCITAAKIAAGAIDAATFAADVDAEILSYLVDDGTRIDASSLNTATVTTIPAIVADTEDIQSRLPAALTGGGNIKADALAFSGNTSAADNAESFFDTAGFGPILQRTTIATLASQTSFTLTLGSADNDAYNDCVIVIQDSATAAQKAVAVIDDYTGSTKTVTLRTDPAVFTMAVNDTVTILADRSLKPTVMNRTLDVTATGAAGIDWGNVENPTTTLNLSGTTIKTATDVETDTNELQTDWANGGRLDLIVDAILADTNELQTDDYPSRFTGIEGAGFSSSTDSLEAIRNQGDSAWATATGFSTHSAADVWAVATRVLTAGTNIQLPANGLANVSAWTVAITGNITGNLSGSVGSLATQAKADVNAEVDSAIETYHLDHLLAADYDPANKPGTSTALLNELVENDGGVSRFTSNALEQGPSGSGATAQQVWEYAARTLTAIDEDSTTLDLDATIAAAVPTVAQIADAVWDELLSGHAISGSAGAALSAAGTAGDPWITALPGAYAAGTAGYLIGTYINASLSTIAANVAAILADTGTDGVVVSGTVNANVTKVNSITVGGAGTRANPWGPAS